MLAKNIQKIGISCISMRPIFFQQVCIILSYKINEFNYKQIQYIYMYIHTIAAALAELFTEVLGHDAGTVLITP